ncbi:MAG: HAD family phosphatase [Candidatus Galacturonibacter soehngenii]|nr:HAD family phosphatase [Candidatus Galacturonibacter soehngenii]
MYKLNHVEGVIFDMDGTLIDSMSMWENIASDYLKKNGYQPEANLGSLLKTMSLLQGTEYVIKTYSMKETVKEILDGINELAIEKYEKELKPKEGAVELVQSLAKRGINMCVATASDSRLAKLCLERIGILNLLKGVYTCGEIGVGKDSPILFEYALEQLGTTKETTYVFEDSLYAVETAKKAGFPVVAIYDEASKEDEIILREKADIYINSMKELL